MSNLEKSSWAFGILLSVTVSLGGFVLYESYQVHAELAVLQEQMKVNRTVKKHWKLHAWAKDQINELRIQHDLHMRSWPSLSSEEPH